jgi:hypothetical protein
LNYLGVEMAEVVVFVNGGGGELVGNKFICLGEVANVVGKVARDVEWVKSYCPIDDNW